MDAALLRAMAGPSHSNLIVAGLTELALSTGLLIFIASAFAISVGHALRSEAKAIEVETSKTLTIAYAPRVGSVA